MDCCLPGSSAHGILQARVLQWVAIPFSRGSSWPRDRTHISCTAGRFFTVWAIRDAPSFSKEPWIIRTQNVPPELIKKYRINFTTTNHHPQKLLSLPSSYQRKGLVGGYEGKESRRIIHRDSSGALKNSRLSMLVSEWCLLSCNLLGTLCCHWTKAFELVCGCLPVFMRHA